MRSRKAPRVPVHRWLFGIAITSTVAAVPHVASARPDRSAAVMFHLTATLGLWLFAELRRQWWERSQAQGDIAELVAAVEEDRQAVG